MADEAAAARRLFFALWPDDALRREMGRLLGKAVGRDGGRPVPAENLHNTLKFLGSVTPEQLTCIRQVAEGVRAGPFTLSLDRLGHFPRPRVIWLGASQLPAALRELVQQLERGLAGCGFPTERRPYQAHVTLMRKARQPPREETCQPLSWQVADFVLVESQTLPSGAEYQVIGRWPLGT